MIFKLARTYAESNSFEKSCAGLFKKDREVMLFKLHILENVPCRLK